MSTELDYSMLYTEAELKEITDLIRSGNVCGWWGKQSGGKYVNRFENRIKVVTDLKYAKAVSNGTSSIYLALRALGVQKNDLVFTTAYNHVGGLAPITLNGSIPLFVDVDQFGNMDYNSLYYAVDDCIRRPQTQCKMTAVIITHSLGQPCAETKKIVKLAHDNDMTVIEDCSQALGSEIDGFPVGGVGDAACYSVGGDMTKMITTGEGGIIATNTKFIADAVDNLRNHGDKAGALYPCFNFRMSDLNALIGLITLNTLDMQLLQTKVNADHLIRSIKGIWKYHDPPKNTKPSHYIMKFSPEGPTDPQAVVDKIEKTFGKPKPRMAVSRGYTKMLNELPVARNYPHTRLDNTHALSKESLWIDWHRWPHTKETMASMIDAIKEVF